MALHLQLLELRVLSHISQNTKNGWYVEGAAPIARKVLVEPLKIKVLIRDLQARGYLHAEDDDLGRICRVRLSEKAMQHRIEAYKELFPDVQKVLLEVARTRAGKGYAAE